MARPLLYIKPGCPWCLDALAFFARHHVELDVRDVTASPADLRHMMALSGQSRTPTFEHGAFLVADFSVQEFLDRLAQAPAVRHELGLDDARA